MKKKIVNMDNTNNSMVVKDLLSHFPDFFWTDICTPNCRPSGPIKKLMGEEWLMNQPVSNWRITTSNILQIDC